MQNNVFMIHHCNLVMSSVTFLSLSYNSSYSCVRVHSGGEGGDATNDTTFWKIISKISVLKSVQKDLRDRVFGIHLHHNRLKM